MVPTGSSFEMHTSRNEADPVSPQFESNAETQHLVNRSMNCETELRRNERSNSGIQITLVLPMSVVEPL